MKRVVITNNSLNSHGSRVLTSGMDIEQYKRNPVLLYMHRRGDVIGYLKDIRVEGDEITAEPVFDEATELSKQCKAQWEFGSLKMVSIGADVVEVSMDKSLLVEGQRYETVTKSKLYEVSVVDIGANDDAIALTKLGSKEPHELKLIDNNNKTQLEMDLNDIKKQLDLSAEATDMELQKALNTLQEKAKNCDQLQEKINEMELSAVTLSVEQAVKDGKITAEKKEYFISLGKKMGSADLESVFASMKNPVRLSQQISLAGKANGAQGNNNVKTWRDYSPAELQSLRTSNVETYKQLYEKEFGVECVIEQ